jgi:tRNA-dihydrouridine synthase A
LHLSLNGGVKTLDDVADHVAQGMDGVMIGRAAYHDPASVLLGLDARFFGGPSQTAEDVVHEMLPYIERHLTNGGRLHQVTRHMLGLFNGRPGARTWRQMLSMDATRDGAGPDVLLRALAQVGPRAEAA